MFKIAEDIEYISLMEKKLFVVFHILLKNTVKIAMVASLLVANLLVANSLVAHYYLQIHLLLVTRRKYI